MATKRQAAPGREREGLRHESVSGGRPPPVQERRVRRGARVARRPVRVARDAAPRTRRPRAASTTRSAASTRRSPTSTPRSRACRTRSRARPQRGHTLIRLRRYDEARAQFDEAARSQGRRARVPRPAHALLPARQHRRDRPDARRHAKAQDRARGSAPGRRPQHASLDLHLPRPAAARRRHDRPRRLRHVLRRDRGRRPRRSQARRDGDRRGDREVPEVRRVVLPRRRAAAQRPPLRGVRARAARAASARSPTTST